MIRIGQQLRAAREAQGLSIEALFETTRIAVHVIQAIEAGETAHLPLVHYRAFVRTLAGALDLDAQALLATVTPEPAVPEEVRPETVVLPPDKSAPKGSRRLLYSVGAVAAIGVLALAWLYGVRGRQLFSDPPVPSLPTEAGGWTVLADTDFVALQGILEADTVVTPPPPTEVKAPATPRLRGRISPETLIRVYPVYARLRDQYLPNAVTLSRLEALKPDLAIDVYFAPDDTLAQRLVSPLLQIRRAAYLPDMQWTLHATEGRRGEPLIVVSQAGEVMVRWSKRVEQRLEVTLLDIANVADRQKRVKEESPS